MFAEYTDEPSLPPCGLCHMVISFGGPTAQLLRHTSHNAFLFQRRVPFYLHKAIFALPYVLSNFLLSYNRTLPYNHGLPVQRVHYTCTVIRGYLDVYKCRTANDPDFKGRISRASLRIRGPQSLEDSFRWDFIFSLLSSICSFSVQDLKGQKCVESELKSIDWLLRLYSGRREIQVCILVHMSFRYTRPAALNFSVYSGKFPSCVHEEDRNYGEQPVQYVQSDQGLFLASTNSVW